MVGAVWFALRTVQAPESTAAPKGHHSALPSNTWGPWGERGCWAALGRAGSASPGNGPGSLGTTQRVTDPVLCSLCVPEFTGDVVNIWCEPNLST